MTIQLNEGDRLYKIIEAMTFGNERKRFISKIYRNGKITVYTYIFNKEDISEDRTIASENKRMELLIKDIDKDKFKLMMDTNYKIYPDFKIIWEKDYSDKSLEKTY